MIDQTTDDRLDQEAQAKEAAFRRLAENEDYLNFVAKPLKLEAQVALNAAVNLAILPGATRPGNPVQNEQIVTLLREYGMKEKIGSMVHDHLEAREAARQNRTHATS